MAARAFAASGEDIGLQVVAKLKSLRESIESAKSKLRDDVVIRRPDSSSAEERKDDSTALRAEAEEMRIRLNREEHAAADLRQVIAELMMSSAMRGVVSSGLLDTTLLKRAQHAITSGIRARGAAAELPPWDSVLVNLTSPRPKDATVPVPTVAEPPPPPPPSAASASSAVATSPAALLSAAASVSAISEVDDLYSVPSVSPARQSLPRHLDDDSSGHPGASGAVEDVPFDEEVLGAAELHEHNQLAERRRAAKATVRSC